MRRPRKGEEHRPMWPCHPGVHVIVGILILIIPVPISTSWGVITILFSSPLLFLFMVSQVVLWSGLVFVLTIIFVAVSVLALSSTLQAVAWSSGSGCWVMLVILLHWALINIVLLVVGLTLVLGNKHSHLADSLL